MNIRKIIIGSGVSVLAIVAIIFTANFLIANAASNALVREAQVVNVATLVGVPVTASEFVHNPEIEVAFATAVNFNSPGRQNVRLRVVHGRRYTYTSAHLYIMQPAYSITHEAGTQLTDYSLFFNGTTTSARLDIVPLTNLDELALASADTTQVISLTANGTAFEVIANIVDTTPPTAVMMPVVLPMGQQPKADDFVREIFDASPISEVAFVTPPYMFTPGEQKIQIFISDIFGNYAIYDAYLYILPGTVPPVITGVYDLSVQVGSSIMFRRGVEAKDAFDRNITFNVDDSELDLGEPGVYQVRYIATCSSGLTTTVYAYVTVLNVDVEWVRYTVDNFVANITNPNMTQVQKARAIFNWVNANVSFVATINHRNIYEGAYQALRHRRGDCYTFQAVTQMMLTSAGIPNYVVSRVGGTTSHYWLIINPDDLGWHHLDPTPVYRYVAPYVNRFMFTASDARRFTNIIQNHTGVRNYYTYDASLLPEIVQ